MSSDLDRRGFLRGTAALGAGAIALGAPRSGRAVPELGPADGGSKGLHIRRYVRLGRTGFEVSDIGFGSGGLEDPRAIHRAYDVGINYFDTAEMGFEAELMLGKALKGKRHKVHITTKAITEPHFKRERIMRSLEGSLQRLQTDYVDIFLCHAVNDVERLQAQGWHEFVELAKRQGKIRFAGMSGHGGRLQECLDYALEGNMVDVILCSHNFGTDPAFYEKFTKAFDLIANQQGIQRLFRKAREKDVGVLCMKTLMGAKLNDLRKYEWGGATFAQAAFRWVLSNPDVNALVVSMKTVAHVDEYVAASGTAELGLLDRRLLRNYVREHSHEHCRQGCGECAGSCPLDVPIADVLRSRMYEVSYEDHAKALDSYGRLGAGASPCVTCTSQACLGACPYGLEIPKLTREAARLLGPASRGNV